MAKVTLRNSFLQIYKETTDYSYPQIRNHPQKMK